MALIKNEIPEKPTTEKLILDRFEVTPIQMMGIGASLEIGAVQSLMEGLRYHRYAASTLFPCAYNGKETRNKEQYAFFYAEWKPKHSDRLHRYIIEVRGEVLALLPGTSRPYQKNEGGD